MNYYNEYNSLGDVIYYHSYDGLFCPAKVMRWSVRDTVRPLTFVIHLGSHIKIFINETCIQIPHSEADQRKKEKREKTSENIRTTVSNIDLWLVIM